MDFYVLHPSSLKKTDELQRSLTVMGGASHRAAQAEELRVEVKRMQERRLRMHPQRVPPLVPGFQQVGSTTFLHTQIGRFQFDALGDIEEDQQCEE